jgi:hypothetical protein
VPAFKLTTGKEFLVKVDAVKIRDVRKECEVDLAGSDGSWADDPVKVFEVLWVLCRSQADGMTSEQFSDGLCGESFEAAHKALAEATADFFPDSVKSVLRSLTEKTTSVKTKAAQMAAEKIQNADLEAVMLRQFEAQLDQAMSRLLTGATGATNLPESSESTPKGSPLGTCG